MSQSQNVYPELYIEVDVEYKYVDLMLLTSTLACSQTLEAIQVHLCTVLSDWYICQYYHST